MSDEHHELIIVRRHEEEEHTAHSSAWKVAHADFMTAMMAFFLIMWLINVTDDKVRKGISQYFNPIHLSEGSTDLKGLNPPDPANAGKTGKKGANEPKPEAVNPLQLSGAANEAAAAAATAAAAGAAAASASAKSITEAAGAQATPIAGGGSIAPDQKGAGAQALPGGAAPSGGYQDPYAVLSKVKGDTASTDATTATSVIGDPRPLGAAGGTVSRDPFDPAYWQLTQAAPARAASPGSPTTADKAPPDAMPDAASAAAQAATTANLTPNPLTATPPSSVSTAPPPPPATPPGASSAASASPPDTAPPPAPVTADIDKGATPQTAAAAQAIAAQVAKLAPSALAGAAPDLTVTATSEGTLMRLTDEAMYSMFPVGSAKPDAKVVAVLASIAKALTAETGDVIIRGYTDGRPFHTSDNDNWRLSAARARAAYDLLIHAGLDEKRIVAIEGHADRDLLNAADPYAAENRRIEILLKVAN